MSGPFRIQVGVDGAGAPVYSECGRLTLYKVAGGGREWRLDDTCDELIDVMLPIIQPTPTPTPIGGTPTPGPSSSPGSAECPDGFFTKVSNTHWALNNVVLQEEKTHIFCADLPASQRPFFEIYTINKGNASCSDVEMTVVSPRGAEYHSNGPSPGVPPFVDPGRWQIKLLLKFGCARYDFNIAY